VCELTSTTQVSASENRSELAQTPVYHNWGPSPYSFSLCFVCFSFLASSFLHSFRSKGAVAWSLSTPQDSRLVCEASSWASSPFAMLAINAVT